MGNLKENFLNLEMNILEFFKNNKNFNKRKNKIYLRYIDILNNPYYLEKCLEDGKFLFLKYADLYKIKNKFGKDYLKKASEMKDFHKVSEEIYLFLLKNNKNNMFLFKDINDMYFFDVLLDNYGEDKEFILNFSKVNPRILKNHKFIDLKYLYDKDFFIEFVVYNLNNVKIDFSLLKKDMNTTFFKDKEIIEIIFKRDVRIANYMDESLKTNEFIDYLKLVTR